MSSTKATYLMHQEKKTIKERVSCATLGLKFCRRRECYIIEEVIEVDELVDFEWKMPFHRRRPLMEDNL